MNTKTLAAGGGRFERGVMALVDERACVGVLQKRSCVVWLLCYSNCIDNATGEQHEQAH